MCKSGRRMHILNARMEVAVQAIARLRRCGVTTGRTSSISCGHSGLLNENLNVVPIRVYTESNWLVCNFDHLDELAPTVQNHDYGIRCTMKEDQMWR